MRKNRKYIYLIISVLLFTIVIFAPKITYKIDSSLVSQDKRPIFVMEIEVYKDGGTTEYRGLGYQVIKWNRLTEKGTEFGYEIFKAPSFRSINDGPTKELRVVSGK